MLDLDSPRWSELGHAYGDAADLPDLLRRLSAGDGSVMNDLFGSVCHQGSVYSASYAVLPHLVTAARAADDTELRAEILILAGSIRASSDDRSGAQPAPDIHASYERALPDALELAVATLRAPMDAFTAVHLLQAAAALKGYMTLGRVLDGFLDEEFSPVCPGCGRDLYVRPDGVGLTVAAEDPVSVPDTKRVQVAPGPIPGSMLAPAFEWLMQVGGSSALSKIGESLPFLFGSAVCPACDHTFSLIDELGGDAS
jgi:hypothetical protein